MAQIHKEPEEARFPVLRSVRVTGEANTVDGMFSVFSDQKTLSVSSYSIYIHVHQ